MQENQKKINVVIAGRSFPVKVTEKEEEAVRKIEKDINVKIREYQLKYSEKDKLDLVIMVMLTNAFELERANKLTAYVDQIHSKLDTLESTIDNLSKD